MKVFLVYIQISYVGISCSYVGQPYMYFLVIEANHAATFIFQLL